jgi:hypothetical protein
MSFPKRPNRLHSMAALRKHEVHTAQQSLLLPAVLALDQHKRLSKPTLRVTQTAKGLAGGKIVELSDPLARRSRAHHSGNVVTFDSQQRKQEANPPKPLCAGVIRFFHVAPVHMRTRNGTTDTRVQIWCEL